MSKKVFLVALLMLNTMVLAGQIWPEKAPPFAMQVNIAFLSFSWIYFLMMIIKRRNGD